MFVTENLAALRADMNALRRHSSAIALVPTMGALHPWPFIIGPTRP